MPLILDPSNYWDWLHESTEKNIKELLSTFTNQEIVSYPVSKDLFSNKIDTNTPGIIKEVPIQNGLFQKIKPTSLRGG